MYKDTDTSKKKYSLNKFEFNSPFKMATYNSFFFTFLAICLQLFFTSNTSYLGVDTSTTSRALAQAYPFVALSELLKVLFFIGTHIVLLLLTQEFFRKFFPHNNFSLIFIFTISYMCFLFGSILENPAIYESFLPSFVKYLCFKMAFYLNPNFFFLPLYIFFLFSFVFWLIILYQKFRSLSKKSHSTLLLLTITLSIFGILYQSTSTDEKLKLDNYNTYLIAIDSLRYDRTLNKAITPNISSLKSEKNVVTFHDHHIGVPRTFPSWVEMLNGKYSPRTGIRHMFPAMPVRRSPTIGLNHYLSKLKYTNSVVSDFAGDIFPRFNGGYDFIKTPNLTLDILILTGIDLSFPLFLPLMTSPLGLKFFEHLKGSPNFADPKRLVGISKELIKNVDSLHFMTIFFSTAHFPYAASWPWYTKFTDEKYSGPFYFQKSPNLINEENISPSDIKQVRSLYNGSIASIDDSIGKFITWLKEQNLYDKSLIIITADHGEDLYENNLSQGHGEHLIGENVTKVPLIIKFPSPVEIQTKNIYFTSRSVDIMPTVLSILGKKVNAIDGVDLSQWVLNGESPKPPLKAYSETGLWFTKKGRSFFQKKRLLYPGVSQMLNFDPGGTGDIILRPGFEPIVVTAKHRSLVFENFKLIYIPDHHGVKFSLYDRFKDPDNKIDIKDKFPKKFLELKESLKNMVSNMEVTYKNVDGYWIKM